MFSLNAPHNIFGPYTGATINAGFISRRFYDTARVAPAPEPSSLLLASAATAGGL
jgi:hypothetical protein